MVESFAGYVEYIDHHAIAPSATRKELGSCPTLMDMDNSLD